MPFGITAPWTRRRPGRTDPAIPALQAAIGYLRSIADHNDALRIIEQEQIERRCRYCHCNGWLDVREYVLDYSGAANEPTAGSYHVYSYNADEGCYRSD